MPLIRLDKYITDTGACSRSRARDRIRSGAVLVNGAAVTDPSAKIDPSAEKVCFSLKPHKTYLFDAETSERIYFGG